MLSRPIVSIDTIDNGVLDAKFGSQGQLKPLLSSLRKKHGISPTPDLDITPTTMPKTEIRVGPELPRLAIKMCSALGSLLLGFTPDELYPSSGEAERFVGNVTYDFARTSPTTNLGPRCRISPMANAKRRASWNCQVLRRSSVYLPDRSAKEPAPTGCAPGRLRSSAGAESFHVLPLLNLNQTPTEVSESVTAAATEAWVHRCAKPHPTRRNRFLRSDASCPRRQ